MEHWDYENPRSAAEYLLNNQIRRLSAERPIARLFWFSVGFLAMAIAVAAIMQIGGVA